jgi:predicted regulator of Ras-like GTPase activity (Roadblock/LC7/MglB family)
MNDFVLYPEDIERLGVILRKFIDDAHIVCTLLTQKDGQLLTREGDTESIDTTSVAALLTGSFAATVAIANILGEQEFSTMFHRGKDKHFHIVLVDKDRYLASVFDNSTSVEKVGYYAARAAKELAQFLEEISGNVNTAFLPDEEEDASAPADVENVFQPLQDGFTEPPVGAPAELAVPKATESIPRPPATEIRVLQPAVGSPVGPEEETPSLSDAEETAATTARLTKPEDPVQKEPAPTPPPVPAKPQNAQSTFLGSKVRQARAYRSTRKPLHPAL